MKPEREVKSTDTHELVEALPTGVVLARDRRVVSCNETFARMMGESVDELYGRPLEQFVVPGTAKVLLERYDTRQRGDPVPDTWELELIRRDRPPLRVEIEPRALGPGEHLVVLRDVSGTLRDIELANRLSALALALQRERSPRGVLAATEAGLREIGLRVHAFRLDGDELEVHAGPQAATEPGRFAWRSIPPFPRVLEQREAVYLDQLPPDARESIRAGAPVEQRAEVEQLLAELAVRKSVVAPLIVADRTWGAIAVDAPALSPRDAATISLFAAQVAGAIENAETFAELARTNRGLRAIHEVARAGTEHELGRILPRLLEVAATSTASDRSTILLVDRERGELQLAGSHGSDCDMFERVSPADLRTGPIAQALDELRPVVLRDLPDAIRACVLFPLQVQGRVSGLLCLGRTTDLPYRDDEVTSVAPLVAQLAIQVENARLYSETRRQLDMLSVVNSLSRTISGTLEVAPLAFEALGLLTDRLGIDAGWIYVNRDERLVLAGHRVRGGADHEAAPAAELAVGRGSICGVCASERRAVVSDLDTDDLCSPTAKALGMRHMAAFPLLAEDVLVGTLSVGRRAGKPFRDEEIQLIESCAVQLAVALERARLFDAERRRVLDLSRLNELGALISQQLELPALLSVGVEHLERLVDVPQVFLALLEPDGGPLRIVASNIREPGVHDITIPLDAPSAAAAAVRDLRPVMVQDAQTDPRGSRAIALRFGHHGVLSVPLISRGEALGVVTLCETRKGRPFEPASIERAVAMANQLAAAVANARLFEEERHRVRELSLLSELGRIASGTLQREVLLSECLGLIRSSLAFGSGEAWVVQRGRLERVASQVDPGAPAGTGPFMAALAARALASGAPAAEAGPDGLSACALPLLAGAEIGGVLAFARQGAPVADSDLRTLAAAAPELGVALQNARLFADARRRVEELRLLLDIGRAITGSLDLDQILESSASTLSRFADSSNAFVLLLDAASAELRGAACSNPVWRDEFRRVRIPLDEMSIAARCVRGRLPIAVNDISISEFRDNERVVRFGEKSVLALPLLVRDEPIGCVLVDDTVEPREWSPAEVERAALIAHQVAVAVANARLYDDLKRSYGELARTQEELVKRERLAALGELSAVVAHEVRNPLGVIFNSLGSLRKLLRPTGDAGMLLDIVEEEADSLDRIVRDLLDFARPHEPALEAEDIGELVADTLHAAQGDHVPGGVEVDVQLPADLPLVRIDERMIRQVLLNLVLNAMQAMPRGGTLRIGVSMEPGRTRFVRIEVSDTGTGVPNELAGRIFQPFFTTKAAGTGLGLAVVKRFVEAHRGTITFHSRQGEGTTVLLRLPVDEAQ